MPRPTRAKLTIRNARPADRGALARLCRRTARAFDPLLAADPGIAPFMYLFPYLDLEPDLALVAARDGEPPEAYALAAPDVRRFRAREADWLRRKLPELVIEHGRGLLGGSRGNLRSSLGGLRYRYRHVRSVVRAERRRPPDVPGVDLDRYPPQAHLQVSPELGDGRVGLALFTKVQARLRERGVPGQHASVLAPAGEVGYPKMLEALGFERVHRETLASPVDGSSWERRVLVRAYP